MRLAILSLLQALSTSSGKYLHSRYQSSSLVFLLRFSPTSRMVFMLRSQFQQQSYSSVSQRHGEDSWAQLGSRLWRVIAMRKRTRVRLAMESPVLSAPLKYHIHQHQVEMSSSP